MDRLPEQVDFQGDIAWEDHLGLVISACMVLFGIRKFKVPQVET